MRRSVSSVFGVTLTAAAVIVLAAPRPTEAAANETPAAVGVAAKNSLAEIKAYMAALRDAEAVMTKMESDPVWQKTCFELVHKGDKPGLAAFVQRAAATSKVEVLSIADWTATFSFHAFGKKVDVCASSEKGCGGFTASVSIDLR